MSTNTTPTTTAAAAPPVEPAQPAQPVPTAPAAPLAPAASTRGRTIRRVLVVALPIVLVVAVFGFAFPQLASYSSVLDTLGKMSAPWIAVVTATALLNLLANWFLISTAIPGLSLPRAGAANLASTAVANTVPGGGALAMGVSWRMLAGWGVSTADFGVYAVVTGVWSALAKMATPGLAVLVLAFTGQLPTGATQAATLWTAALVGLGCFITVALVIRVSLRDENAAVRAGHAIQRAADRLFRIFRRTAPTSLTGFVVKFRAEASGLLRHRGVRLTLATIVSDLGWWVVLQSCLLACGVPLSEVSWSRCFAAFALARLISTIPITPGGLGLVDFGLGLYLSSGLDAATTAQVAAAVLLTRALTYALPIPIGAVTYLGWQLRKPALAAPH